MHIKTLAHYSPGRVALSALAIVITLGTLLLALPICQTNPIAWFDLVFTAISATCVTGLFTIPLSSFTLWGHIVILLLIQIGGLGLITMMLFFISLFTDLGMSTQLMAGKLLELDSWSNSKKILLCLIGVTLITEIVGALFIFLTLINYLPYKQASFLAVFHAISTFCHAGIVPAQKYGSAYLTHPAIIAITAIIMIISGLGFISWREIGQYIAYKKMHKRFRFSLHTKIVLYGSAGLILASSCMVWLLEHNHLFANKSLFSSLSYALANSIAARGGGHFTTPFANFQPATLLLILIIAFIGAAPGSTGSGIKITTLILLIATIRAAILGKTSVEMKGRSIPIEQVFKTFAIVSISVTWILGTTFILLIGEPHIEFFSLLTAASSAFTTLGATLIPISTLSMVGKVLLAISMMVGRIGSLTLVLALRIMSKHNKTDFTYPEERVMLG